jgi:hypothetical protein
MIPALQEFQIPPVCIENMNFTPAIRAFIPKDADQLPLLAFSIQTKPIPVILVRDSQCRSNHRAAKIVYVKV